MAQKERCPICNGAGRVKCPAYHGFMGGNVSRCPTCHGQGKILCGGCGGSGYVIVKRS